MKEFRFGVCAAPTQIAAAARAGYDYVELNLNEIITMSEAQYRAMAADMRDNHIYAETLYGILPKDVKIIGSGVSSREIHAALDVSFDAARALGASLLIFDCAENRALPVQFDPAEAWRQLGNFIRMLQSHAADSDMQVSLLPLRRSAADLLNYTGEATLISAMLRLDRVGVAASLYNMAMEAESLPQLRRVGSLLWHMRVSNVLGNRPPKSGDGENYADLFAVLHEMDYGGRVTMEAPCGDFEKNAAESLAHLKAFLK